MSKIILIYSSTDGHTQEICSRLCHNIEKEGHEVVLTSIDDVGRFDLKDFEKIVIGASIRYGKHRPHVYTFIDDNLQVIDAKLNAFFSVNVVARKPHKNQPSTNPYLRKFLSQTSWQPKKLAVFAGKIDYLKYNLADRLMIKMIMWMTKGSIHPDTAFEFTDWAKVDEFARVICDM